MQNDLRSIARALGGEVSGDQVLFPAIGHSKKDRSVAVKFDKNGQPIIHSFTGDDPLVLKDYVRERIGMEAFISKNKQTSVKSRDANKESQWYALIPIPENAPPPPLLAAQETRYIYHDAQGNLAYFQCRFDRQDRKTFSALSYGHSGDDMPRWERKSPAAPRLLYNLHLLTQYPQAVVILCEGEKAADAAMQFFPLPDYVCITSPNGAQSPNKSDWRSLAGRVVLCWQDNDSAGTKYAQMVAQLLPRCDYHILDILTIFGDKPQGWDAADALKEGYTAKQVQELFRQSALMREARKETQRLHPKRLRATTAHDFLAMDLPPLEMLLDPIIARQGLGMLSAWRGIGKTHFAWGIVYALACGASFLKWKAARPVRVLLVDGEMPACTLQERLAQLVNNYAYEPPGPDYLRIITPDLQERGIPDLSTQEGQEAIEEWLDDVEVIILDNLSTLCRSGKENEGEAWLPIQEWALSLRRRGKSVLFIHHNGKNGQQRGTSRREDVLDTVINLVRPSDYNAEQGARVEVRYEKTRGFFGDNALPFEAWLKTDGKKSWWETKDLTDSNLEQIIELAKNSNLKQRDIAAEIGISKSKVNRLIKKAREEGKL